MTKKQKYDLAIVISSIESITFFEDLSPGTKELLKKNVKVLKKMEEESEDDEAK